MTYAQKCVAHFKTVCKHKKNVLEACIHAGIPFQGLTHDMSKFLPVEFAEYAKYYGEGKSPVDRCKEEKGYCNSWMHHKGHNPHHYEYWIDNLDNGGTPLIMPYKYAIEMVCDYIGAGRTYMGDKWTIEEPLKYWMEKRKTAKVHPAMDRFFTDVFSMFAISGWDALNPDATKALYKTCCEMNENQKG